MAKKFYIHGNNYLHLTFSKKDSWTYFSDFEMLVLKTAIAKETNLLELYRVLEDSMRPLISHCPKSMAYKVYVTTHIPQISVVPSSNIKETTKSPKFNIKDIEKLKDFPKAAKEFITNARAVRLPKKVTVPYDKCSYNMDVDFVLNKLEKFLFGYKKDFLPLMKKTFALDLSVYELQEHIPKVQLASKFSAFYLIGRNMMSEGFVGALRGKYYLTQEISRAHIFFDMPKEIEYIFDELVKVEVLVSIEKVGQSNMSLATDISSFVEREKLSQQIIIPKATRKAHKI